MARIDPRLRVLLPWITALIVLGGWELAAQLKLAPPYLLPALSKVAVRIWQDLVSGALPASAAHTLWRAAAGFAISATVGVALGVLIARNALVKWFFDPLVSVGLPLPKIAFIPVFVLWFGVFDQSKILMVAFSAVFPVIVATTAGTEYVEKQLLWSARSLGMSPARLLWHVAIPAALPQIFTGLQIALPTALIVTVVTEMTMGGGGIGGDMIGAIRFMDSTGVFAGIVSLAIIGLVLVDAMERLRKRFLVWHQEAQQA